MQGIGGNCYYILAQSPGKPSCRGPSSSTASEKPSCRGASSSAASEEGRCAITLHKHLPGQFNPPDCVCSAARLDPSRLIRMALLGPVDWHRRKYSKWIEIKNLILNIIFKTHLNALALFFFLDLFQFKDCFVCMTVCSNVERLTKTTWRRCLAGGGGDGNDSDVRSRGTVVGEEGEP